MFNLLSPQERNEAILICEDMPIEELRKFYTLSKYDFSNIEKYKTNPNRLGFAIQLCVLRHKGWTLSYIQNIPISIVEYIAQQLNMSPNHYEHYHNRKNTIFDHFKDIKLIYDYKELNEENIGNLIAFLESLFKKSDNSYFLISGCLERLKSFRIVLPVIYRIEEIVGEAKVSNESKVIDMITEFLTDDQKKKIDFLLELYGESNFSSLAWLRDDIGKPSNDTLLEVIKRIDKIDDIKFKLDLSGIPSYKIEQFIRLGKRYEPFSLRRFEDKKRHAIMSIYLMDLKQCLIDKAITIHDLKMNGIFGKIKNNQAELVKKQRKYIKEAINDYVVFGNTVIEANDSKKDIGKTIENKITWEKFKKSVQEAEKLSNKTKKSTLDMLNSYYGELRKYTPILLKKL
ncbi:MAG: Transposase [uncultured bacterium]|nr:MAG: Transposase [uncultured bacterium]